MKQALGWAALALTGAFVAFNLEQARVRFLGIEAHMPIGVVVLISAGLGALATYALLGMKRRG